MNKLDNFIYNFNKKELDETITRSYKYFGYEYPEDYKSDLQILLEYVYTDISIVSPQDVRLAQDDFKKLLVQKYGSKCLISGNPVEFQACHIIDNADGGTFDVNNGLLLENNLHYTFDNHAWTINPDTLLIEINPKKNNYTILKYLGSKIDLDLNPFIYSNLLFRYNKFKEELENN